MPAEPVDQFRARLRGEIIQPADPAYDSARRVYNGMIDKRPALIAKCADVADVIDLSRMKGVRVDPDAGTVQAQGGCTWGDVDHATHAFGMATPSGILSTTGVGGLTLGGGLGHL